VTQPPAAAAWLPALRAYLALSAGLHLVWEIVQLPLYTLWRTGTPGEIAFAVAHCTAGDVMIASLALLAALALLGSADWPAAGLARVLAAAVAVGIAYTIYSEWVNTRVRGSWAYAEWMPVLPMLGTGLSPLLQWVVVPPLAMHWAMALAHPRG
jgi:hypothetical protein